MISTVVFALVAGISGPQLSGLNQSVVAQVPKDNPRRIYQLRNLERVKIKIGKHEFNPWVMDTDGKRQEGMMWLTNADFKDSDAMIFMYGEEFQMSFWMRNTLVDLDIAFVNSKNQIVRTVTMKRLDETLVPSRKPAKYAIEFKAGLLKKLGITEGMTVNVPATVKSKD